MLKKIANPKITIIIPVYNTAAYLAMCIDSLLAQTFSDFEVILIDDGSTDNSPEVLQQYAIKDEKLAVVTRKNAGVSAARNVGLCAAKGTYIMFVDSDDYLEPNALEILYAAAVSETCDLVCASFQKVYEDGHAETFRWSRRTLNTPRELADLCYEMKMDISLGGIWCKLYKRFIIEEHNIRFPVGIELSEDNIFNIEYYKRTAKTILLDDIIYNYRQYSASASSSYNLTVSKLKDIMYICTYREKYYLSYSDKYNKTNFSNDVAILWFQSIRALLKNAKIKHSLSDINTLLHIENIQNYIKYSATMSSLSLHNKIYIFTVKRKSPLFIYIFAKIINFLASFIFIKNICRSLGLLTKESTETR